MDAVFSPARFRHLVFTGPTRGRLRGTHAVFASNEPSNDLSPLAYDEETFLRSLFLQAELDIRAYRMETLKRRIPSCLRALRSISLDKARRLVRLKPTLLKTAMNALLIGVSSFFRDSSVFEALSEWLQGSTGPLEGSHSRRALRVWSVACSEGQELYSVAMMLSKLGALESSDLLGTDIRIDAVHTARAGTYGSEDAAAVLDGPWGHYLESTSTDRWQITRPIREAVRWRVGDALSVVEPGTWDLILCRNMAMYLRSEASRRVWQRLQGALRPGGILVTGKAERPDGGSGFSPIGPCLFRRDRA